MEQVSEPSDDSSLHPLKLSRVIPSTTEMSYSHQALTKSWIHEQINIAVAVVFKPLCWGTAYYIATEKWSII